jgi:hypothetical protein
VGFIACIVCARLHCVRHDEERVMAVRSECACLHALHGGNGEWFVGVCVLQLKEQACSLGCCQVLRVLWCCDVPQFSSVMMLVLQ